MYRSYLYAVDYMGSGDQEHCMEQTSIQTVMFIRQFVHVYTVDRYEPGFSSHVCALMTAHINVHLQPHHTNSCAKCQHEETPRPPHRFSTARLLLCLVCNTADFSSTAGSTNIIRRTASPSIALTTQEPSVRASAILSACSRRGIGVKSGCRGRSSDHTASASDCYAIRNKLSAVTCRA